MTEPQPPERTTYRVGKPFHPDVTGWPEGQQFELRFGLPGLLLFYPNPRPDEILAVARRHISLALFTEADQLLLCQVGATEWEGGGLHAPPGRTRLRAARRGPGTPHAGLPD